MFLCTKRILLPFCNCTSTRWVAIAMNYIESCAGLGPGAFHSRYSHVLLIENQVRGCMLARRSGPDTMVVDANVVDPQLRGGWANALLKLEAFRGAFEGVKWIRFTTFDHYTDTRSFTEKLGGSTERITVLMIRPFEQDSVGQD